MKYSDAFHFLDPWSVFESRMRPSFDGPTCLHLDQIIQTVFHVYLDKFETANKYLFSIIVCYN